MNKYDDNLGTAIALLKAEQDNFRDVNEQANKDYIQALRIRAIALHTAGSEARIFNTIPESACYFDQPYLANNTDFFLALFLNESESAACSKLIKHLNDCYSCFEIFTEVVRDYYRQYQLINENA